MQSHNGWIDTTHTPLMSFSNTFKSSMVSSKPKQRRRLVITYFRGSSDFIMQSVYLAVNASLCWLNNVSCVFLSVPTNYKWKYY
jgi:hypothetical protein